jgi:hypothetical protein
MSTVAGSAKGKQPNQPKTPSPPMLGTIDIDSNDSNDEGTKVQVKTLMRQQAEEQRQRYTKQTQLLNIIRELEGRLNASGAANNPGTATTGSLGTAPRPGQVKVPKPDLFYGDRAKFDN